VGLSVAALSHGGRQMAEGMLFGWCVSELRRSVPIISSCWGPAPVKKHSC